MAGRIDKTHGASQDASVYRASQVSPSQHKQQDRPQPEARSSYSFQDSRHVYRGGIAEVNLELAVEEESAEKVELLGFEQGDGLRLDGMGSISGTGLIKTLTDETLEVEMSLSVPQSAIRAASIVFARLSDQPYVLDAEGQVRLTACVSKDGKGGYRYTLSDGNQRDQLLRADAMDLRIDNFSARNTLNQVLTFIVESGSTITFAIECVPGKEPVGRLKVSLAPVMGEFEVSKRSDP